MTILHLSAVKTWGGGENHVENLCYEIQQLSPTTRNSIFCVKNGQFQKKLAAGEMDVISSKLSYKMDPRYIFKIIQVCKKIKPDLIHIHDTTALTLAVMADHFYNLPPFVFSKKTSFPIKNRDRTLHKYNYPKIKKILCVSEETRRVTSQSIRDLQKLTTIYHGTRFEIKSRQTPFLLREKLDLKKNQKIIGNIANHIRAKNLETFIEVADILVNKRNRKDFTFVQIGSFTNRTPALKKKVNSLNLQDHVFFMDFIPDASNFIPQFDVSLLTSQSEGIPGFIYESFLHKVPVVSTRVGGIPEIIEDGINGLLAEKQDSKKLSGLLLSLVEDKCRIREFTELSNKKLLQSFSTAEMAEKTLAEYKKILHGRSK